MSYWTEKRDQFIGAISDPWRVGRAQVSGGLTEAAPVITGKKDWNAAGIGSEMGPPGGKTPMIGESDVLKPITITNPYEQAATQGVGQMQDIVGKLGGLYGTGAGTVTGLIGDLQSQAAGTAGPGKSLGQALLQQGLTQNMAAVQSQLASQRGLSPAIRARMAAQQTAALQGQAAQQAAMLGFQEQIQARKELGQLGMGALQTGVEGQIKGLQQLATSDLGMKELQVKTGLSEDQIRATIYAANQAAIAGDKDRATKLASSLVQGAASVGAAAVMAAHGGRIDGTAPYAGDTPKNDVVKANLSPGEIVIPRSAAGSKEKAKAFLDALDDWDEEPSYSKVLKARRK